MHHLTNIVRPGITDIQITYLSNTKYTLTVHSLWFDHGFQEKHPQRVKFLGVHITGDLSWSSWRRRNYLAWPLTSLVTFTAAPSKSILIGCGAVLYGNSSESNHKSLQRVVHMAQYFTGSELPATQDLYTRRCQRKTLFSVLPHSKRYWSAKSGTRRLLNSFYPQTIRLLNS
jgi:hypothetical protein